MTSTDLIVMLHNLSESLPSINAFIGGFSYLFGIALCITAFIKFKEILNEGGGGGHANITIPTSYFLIGIGLLFLPSLINAFSTTLFGAQNNILAYSNTSPYNIYDSMTMLIQTIGLIWFVRGCVLLGHESKPNHSQGHNSSKSSHFKGILFIIGGLFGINFHFTVTMIDNIINKLITLANIA